MSFLASFPTNYVKYSSSTLGLPPGYKLSYDWGFFEDYVSFRTLEKSDIGLEAVTTGRGVFDSALGLGQVDFILIPVSYTGAGSDVLTLRHMYESDSGYESVTLLKHMKYLVRAIRQEARRLARLLNISLEDMQNVYENPQTFIQKAIQRASTLRQVKYGDPVYADDLYEIFDAILKLVDLLAGLIEVYRRLKIPVPQEAYDALYEALCKLEGKC